MAYFACRGCRQPLTPHLVEVRLPPLVPGENEAGRIRPPRVPRGAWALNLHPDEGLYEPRGVVIHPGDITGTRRHPDPDRLGVACCRGPSGTDGPNLICSVCEADVAAEQGDCWTQNQVVLDLPRVIHSFTEDPDL
ncbi:hypothetical protein [Bailinhaonella thermotolerans]|uniref:Uncharacterized protein n=1 Tax=Bailinhaonella thermotolerans TaxID=1070861 RepID=A0A3A4AZF8_9ACTN|nr:hypothetical protein [Bailinhaonella thermotolerans]RJL31197.1 hypothetical protein D5H75_19200 [Bailinhaonella thermotolerans]